MEDEKNARGNAPERPLNLSTKPKSKGIWSPASLCEEESRKNQGSPTQVHSDSSPESPDNKTLDESNDDRHSAEQHSPFPSALMRNSSLFRPFEPFYNAMRSTWPSALHGAADGSDVFRSRDAESGRHSDDSSDNESKSARGSAEDSSLAHSSGLLLTCSRCDKSFATAQSLDLHVRQAHLRDSTGESSYPCSRCPKIFEHSSQLEQHLATHHPTRSFQVKLADIRQSCTRIFPPTHLRPSQNSNWSPE